MALNPGQQKRHFYGLPPTDQQSCRQVAIQLNFTVAASITDDLTQEEALQHLDMVQSVYIDNSANAAAFTLSLFQAQYGITVKAHTQGWYPFIADTPTKYSASTTPAAGLIVGLNFSNVAIEPCNWTTQ